MFWRSRRGFISGVSAAKPNVVPFTAGWFGPRVDERVYARLGDVIAAARDDVLIIASEREPKESAMVGNHGSMTPAEQLVPLLEVRS